MPELVLKLPAPHDAQALVLADSHRFKTLSMGRRFGKTLVDQLWLTKPLFHEKPGEGDCGWFAPTEKIFNDAWRQVIRWLGPVIDSKREDDRIIKLTTGNAIEFWTLNDKDAGRSRRYRRVVVDEAGLVPDLEEIVNNAIMATLFDFNGEMMLTGTPKGRNGFYKYFRMGIEGSDTYDPDWKSFQASTYCNPFIDPKEIDRFKKTMPDRVFRQEIMGEFIAGDGPVFRGVEECVDSDAKWPRAGIAPFYIGVDIGRYEDFTVITIWDSKLRQCHIERWNQVSWELANQRCAAIHAKVRDALWVVESNGPGDPFIERLVRTCPGIRVEAKHTSNQSKMKMIDHMAMMIEQKKPLFLPYREQIDEMLAYEYQSTLGGNLKTAAPRGEHDDTVIANALALSRAGAPMPRPGYTMLGGRS